MTIAWAVFRLYWDHDRDGDFSESSEEISAYRRAATWFYGCEGSPITSKDIQGELRVEMDNSTGIFSKGKSTSPCPYLDAILPGGLVKLTMQIGEGTETTLFQGDLEDIAAEEADQKADAIAWLTAKGVIGRLINAEVTIAMSTNTLEGTIVGAILDAAAFPAGDRSIDAGQSTIGRHWTPKDSKAIDVIRDVENTTGAKARESRDGKFAWEDRAHRASAPHTTVQATYTNADNGSIRHMSCQPVDTRADIFNIFRAEQQVFDISEDLVLWELSGTAPAIAASATLILEASLKEGGSYLAVNTWTTIDYEAAANADGTGADLSDDVAITQTKYADRQIFTIVNNGASTAYLVILRAHGTAVVKGDPILVSDQSDASITAYGKRLFSSSAPFLTTLAETQGWCGHNKALYKDPHQAVLLRLDANANANHLAEAQRVKLSDRIHVHADSSSTLYIDADFWVERLSYSLNEQGRLYVDLLCGEVVSDTWATSGTAYTPIVRTAIPDDLEIASIDPTLHCTFQSRPWKFKEHVVSARFKAKYYAVEQPGPVDLSAITHDGTNTWVIDGLPTSSDGTAEYELDAPGEGFIYYAFQFVSTAGESVWSDGTRTACLVEHFLPTSIASSAEGPPADWWCELEADPTNHRVRPRASRPKTNGEKIWAVYWQIKDNRSGAWYPLDREIWDGLSNAEIYYGFTGTYTGTEISPPADGSGDWITHALSNDGRRLTRSSGTGVEAPTFNSQSPPAGHYIHPGDLILLDRRGAAFDIDYCLWGLVDTVQGVKSGYNTDTSTYFDSLQRLRTTVTSDLRLLVVPHPSTWTDSGYFGAQPNKGWFEQKFWSGDKHGDTTTEVFVGPWMDVPSDAPLENVEVRAFFDNGYSISDNEVTTGGVVEDTGNPSGASDLVVLTHDDDPNIPEGQVAFQFSRDTTNYKSVWAVAVWLSRTLPAQGPYSAERTGHAEEIIEPGTCTVVRGNKSVTVTRSALADVVGRPFMIWTADGTPDSDLDGNVVASQAENKIILTSPFNKGGAFSYAVIRRFYSPGLDDEYDPGNLETSNIGYWVFPPLQCAGDIEQAVWRTPCVAAPSGAFYATACLRNKFGLGTRMTSAQASAGGGCLELVPYAGEVDTNLDLGKKFRFDTGDVAIQINNPTGTVKCGYPFYYKITGTGDITLDSAFQLRNGPIERSTGGSDLLGCIWDEEDGVYYAFWNKGVDA